MNAHGKPHGQHGDLNLGELLDATIDKVCTFLTIIILPVAHIAHWWIIVSLLIPQAAITIVILYKRRRRTRISA